MLSLASNTMPTETGASSLANCTTVCSAWSSKTRKASRRRPVMAWFRASVTLTGISTRSLSIRKSGRVAGVWPRTGIITRGSSPAHAAQANRQAAPIQIAAPRGRMITAPSPLWGSSVANRGAEGASCAENPYVRCAGASGMLRCSTEACRKTSAPVSAKPIIPIAFARRRNRFMDSPIPRPAVVERFYI